VIRVHAFAKVNLTLRVLGVRPDGYHELSTTFQTLALHDTVKVFPRAGPLELRCTDPAVPVDRTNLVWRAAEQVWRAARRLGDPQGALVRIVKRIPVQAGLGGGSSDAAAAMAAFAQLWNVRLSDARRTKIATMLGADVPFFLHGGTAFGVGRGDRLQLMTDVPGRWVVLVLPDFGVSTKDAYSWWDAEHASDDEEFPPPSAWRVPVGFRRRGDVQNDLQPLVAARHPDIAVIARGLVEQGAYHAAMSGSGSAVFGLFDSRQSADLAARRLKASRRRILITRTLARSRFEKLSRPTTS
jgi:4-diphosphocytidyl-2-C-methyl-D-erythritol kinase